MRIEYEVMMDATVNFKDVTDIITVRVDDDCTIRFNAWFNNGQVEELEMECIDTNGNEVCIPRFLENEWTYGLRRDTFKISVARINSNSFKIVVEKRYNG